MKFVGVAKYLISSAMSRYYPSGDAFASASDDATVSCVVMMCLRVCGDLCQYVCCTKLNLVTLIYSASTGRTVAVKVKSVIQFDISEMVIYTGRQCNTYQE